MGTNLSESQIEVLAPNPAAFKSGKSLSVKQKWLLLAQGERAIWGEIKGSGTQPYKVQIDLNAMAWKCTCPSRQFPCKHSLALLLLYSLSPVDFSSSAVEPEWVKTWIDKRDAKSRQAKPAEERTEEELEKLDKAREKTLANRIESALAGASELEMWLSDVVRLGLLELPSKPAAEFAKVAARMVDAKAPGLAGWVKSLGELSRLGLDGWQSEALELIAKLFLLVRTFKNYENLSPEWQLTIKNLVGWSQSSKELLADSSAETVKDCWLVAGQETETSDDLTTQRNWLIGCQSNRRALVLNFSTRFSYIENPLVPGSILNAELAFFPSVMPTRAVVKMLRSLDSSIPSTMPLMEGLDEVFRYRAEQLMLNPWANDMLVLVKDLRLISHSDQWILLDINNNYLPLVSGFDIQKVMKWLIISGNRPQDAALIIRNTKALPVGIIHDQQYTLL